MELVTFFNDAMFSLGPASRIRNLILEYRIRDTRCWMLEAGSAKHHGIDCSGSLFQENSSYQGVGHFKSVLHRLFQYLLLNLDHL